MNKGFFSLIESQDIIRGDEIERKNEFSTSLSCEDCKLYRKCLSPKMDVTGEGKKKILIIAEAPGKEEDRQGTQLVGESGKLLRSVLNELNLDLDKDFWKTNAVRCRPENNKTPTPIQIACCRKYICKAITTYEPKAIILLGKTAVDSVIGPKLTGRLSGLSMNDFVGCTIPDQELGVWICPTWHPSFILRQNGFEDSVVRDQLKKHIQKAVAVSQSPVDRNDYLDKCKVVTTKEEAVKVLSKMSKEKIISFDLETTGRKPYREGHRIIACSVSNGVYSYGFPYFDDPEFIDSWNSLMQGPSYKIGHNVKFDCLWMRVRGGLKHTESLWPTNILWDTMLAAHILNNKKKTNLKYLTYIYLGVAGYDNSIDKYLESKRSELDDFGSNSFNRIEQAPIDELLKYNAMDSLVTYKMYEIQNTEMTEGMKKAQNLFVQGSMELTKAEYNGLHCDKEETEKSMMRISKKMKFYEDKVYSSEELKKWDREEKFSISSTQDLSHLLFDILKYPYTTTTSTGKPKADKKSIEKYNSSPFVQDILEWRKWKKTRDTYLKGIVVESCNNVIHPFFNLHNVDSYRSSSDSPNFQNYPKRNEEVSTIIRKLLKPSEGHKLGEYDYHAMEVNVISSYNKDPNLIKFITSGNDMHRFIAKYLFMKEEKDVTKKERYLAKNGFVFPTFYGSFYEHTGSDMWEVLEDSTRQELRGKGVKEKSDFIEHVKSVESKFWNEWFPVAHEWTDKVIKEYDSKGYIDLYTGFRCYGPMSRNQVINYHIQGTAFHCLLWTFIQVSRILEARKMQSKLIGQIHDALILDIDPEEESRVDHIIELYGTKKIRETWPWIAVPLQMEKSVSEISGNWAEMKEEKILGEIV